MCGKTTEYNETTAKNKVTIKVRIAPLPISMCYAYISYKY